MTKPAVPSALEVANWFFKRAEKSGIYLEEDKLHSLIYLAQTHYALKNEMQYLLPGLFICNNDGFFEPNLKKILEYGMPLMGKPEISDRINEFLELIWQKYANKNTFELISIIKETPAYRQHHKKDEVTLVSLEDMSRNFGSQTQPASAKKILISQNGPVVVSQWTPRKLKDSKNNQGDNHA